MNAATATIHKRKVWKWPLNLDRYNRSPSLSAVELKTIRVLRKKWHGCYRMDWWVSRLERLVRPILDAQKLFPLSNRDRMSMLRILLREMERRRSSLWSWSGRSWMTICGASRSACALRYGKDGDVRASLMAVAVALKRPIDLQRCGVFERVMLARKIFGKTVVEATVKRVIEMLESWGYGTSHKVQEERVVCEAMY